MTEKWQRALAAMRRARAEMVRFGEASAGADRSFEEQEPLDEAYSDRVVLFNRALQRLLLAPAPDVAALAAKIAVAVDEQAWELPRGETCMARVRADAARLAG